MLTRLQRISKRSYLWAAVIVLLGITLGARDIAHKETGRLPMFSGYVKTSSEDLATYRSIFRAQSENDWETADRLINTLVDQRLLGSILAQRYLETGYASSAGELSLWLMNFSDQPEATRIAALAGKKGAKPAELASLEPALKGQGYVETIGSKDMPARWYRGLSLWRSGDYAEASAAFADAASTETLPGWQRAAVHFWHARALDRTGEKRAATAALRKAAGEPLTFYGMLANARLGKTQRLSMQAPYVPSSLRDHGGYLRAETLTAIGEYDRAEAELRHLYRSLGKNERPALITLASELNLPNLQVRLSRLPGLSEEEAIFASFPMPQWLGDDQTAFDPALMYAISRQESSFAATAKSHAGATGLMQLMPTTANYIWQQSGEELLASIDSAAIGPNTRKLAMADLHDPRTNLLLGQAYLRYLTRNAGIGNDMLRLLAGYNAGPGMVAVWNKSGSAIGDPLLYVESIPYGETRRYVMQVMANYWVYQTLMGGRTDSLQALANGKWPVIQQG